jgi:hypothetical protein
MLREWELEDDAVNSFVPRQVVQYTVYFIFTCFFGQFNVARSDTNFFTGFKFVANIDCGGGIISNGYDRKTRVEVLFDDFFLQSIAYMGGVCFAVEDNGGSHIFLLLILIWVDFN